MLKLAIEDQATMSRGLTFAVISASFIAIAIGVRVHREQAKVRQAALERAESGLRLLDQLKSARMASGVTLRDHIHGVKPPAPPPPTEPAPTQPALYLKRTGLPVPLSHPARSYFGGLPQLPEGLAWPEQTKYDRTVAFLFIAQIDLAEVAAHLPSRLPAQGTLYFFIDGNDEVPDDTNVRVLYHSERADALPMRAPPDTLEPYDAAGASPWPWLKPEDPAARIAFKYPLTFVPFTAHCDYEGLGHESAEERIEAELSAKLSAGEVSILTPRKLMDEASVAWPFCWAVIEYAARAVLYAVDDPFGSRRLSDAQRRTIDDLRARALEWVERVAGEDPLAPCDEETKSAFRAAWMPLRTDLIEAKRDYKMHLRGDPDWFLFHVLHFVCCLCASSDGDAVRLIPDDYRRALENDVLWRGFSPASGHPMSHVHQMLGFGRSVQSGPAVHAEDVLLLQIDGRDSLSWFPTAGCVLQFWINPQALTARRFEETRLTLECD